jgi:hypothetical protein
MSQQVLPLFSIWSAEQTELFSAGTDRKQEQLEINGKSRVELCPQAVLRT